MLRAATSLTVLLFATACASGPNVGPSLLPREAETRSFDEPVAPPVVVAAPDPALDAKIVALVADRTRASTNFAAADRQVAAALAAGARAAIGSDAWLDAQTAIGALDAERAAILSVLTDLELLATARAGELQPPYPALETARTDTETELDRISAIVAGRKAALPL